MTAKNELTDQYITFGVADEEYAISILNVEEIVKVSGLIKVPQAKDYFVGLMDIRGKVVNMIDLGKKLLNRTTDTKISDRAIIVTIQGKSIGVIVEKVSHVIRFPASQIDPPPPSVRGLSSRYITGVAKKDNRFIIIMDIEKILTSDELNEINEYRT